MTSVYLFLIALFTVTAWAIVLLLYVALVYLEAKAIRNTLQYAIRRQSQSFERFPQVNCSRSCQRCGDWFMPDDDSAFCDVCALGGGMEEENDQSLEPNA